MVAHLTKLDARALLALVPLGLCLLSCQGSAQGKAKAGNAGEVDVFADFEAPSVEDERGSVGEFAVQPSPSGQQPALLGARHDVFVQADPVENCSCMTVVAGAPEDPRFGWESKRPQIDSLTQMVVAFRMAGCSDAPVGANGASYRGYVEKGNDVFLMVESAHPGRPLIVGAIVPKPKPGGHLFVESVPASLPYGKPLGSGDGQCRVEP